MKDKRLIVSEIFGPTIQGEGPSAGHPAVFLRLGICNLACVWCDSKYTWDWKNYNHKYELKRMTDVEVWEALDERFAKAPTATLVITGGEPLLQQEKLTRLLSSRPDLRVEIETAGAIIPSYIAPFVYFIVSPKLENSGVLYHLRRNPSALLTHTVRGSTFKFVVQSVEDLTEVAFLVEREGIPSRKVYIMPQGISVQEMRLVAMRILPEIMRRGWKLSWRLQVDLWGSQRGH